jgi:hypothetical protein
VGQRFFQVRRIQRQPQEFGKAFDHHGSRARVGGEQLVTRRLADAGAGNTDAI